MKIKSTVKRRSLLGFTLPEVTVSLGIAAVGVTSTLGLLPQSLATLKKSGDLAAETRITQQIVSTLQQSRWVDNQGNNLLTTNYGAKHLFFDDLAEPLDTGGNPGSLQAYVAEVSVVSPDITLSTSTAPGTASTANPYMRRVTIKIANVGTGDFNFTNAVPGAYHSYASVITRFGK
jgi:uncharacterized protein (TIGR02598 family)